MDVFDVIQKQGQFTPKVEGGVFEHIPLHVSTLIAGLGGSRLAGGILKNHFPESGISVYSGFGVPKDAVGRQSRVVASSASGNVPETMSVFTGARQAQLSVAAVSRGGELLESAVREGVPYVRMPDIGVPPRESIFFSLLSHLALFKTTDDIQQIQKAISSVSRSTLQAHSAELSAFCSRKQVLLYGPDSLEGVLRVWKINFNETSRIPAFVSLLPEANHGEIASFDGSDGTDALSANTVVLFFTHHEVDERISRRMHLLQAVLDEHRIPSRMVELPGTVWESVTYAIALSMLVAHTLRANEGIPETGANLIADFKTKTSLL